MKKIFLVLLVAIMAMACSKSSDPTPIPNFSGKKTYITGVAGSFNSLKGLKSQDLPDLKYIVKYANVIQMYNDSVNDRYSIIGFLFDKNRDTLNLKFVYDEFMIVNADGTINNALIASRDMVYGVRTPNPDGYTVTIDTVAYTPNKILRRAERLVREAYKKQDWATCVAVMDTTFKFYPTTGEKWREMKRLGIE